MAERLHNFTKYVSCPTREKRTLDLLYTNVKEAYRSSPSNGDEVEYRAAVDNFVTCCEQNHLQLNVTKTKELVVDMRRTKVPVTPVFIQGVNVDIVEDYKYLGVHIDNKLDRGKNTDALYRKGQSSLYFLRQLRSFNICRTMLRMCDESVVASALCWGVLGQQAEGSGHQQTEQTDS